MAWTDNEKQFLIKNYPQTGVEWCMKALSKTRPQIRSMASNLGLKQDKNSDFFKQWQEKAKQSKIGKKRPIQSQIMKQKAKEKPLAITEWVKSNGNLISQRQKQQIAQNGHPKGMKGKTHTEKTKQILAEKSKINWQNMSENKKDEWSKKASINGQKQTMNRANASWKAGWREIGGKNKYYRSRWEANYARYLEWLKVNKQIADWAHEPKTFWFEGIKRGTLSYLPDFWVFNLDGTEEFHEVKGWMDDRSKTKLKRMAKYYPNVKLLLIDGKYYKTLTKQLTGLIPDWE